MSDNVNIDRNIVKLEFDNKNFENNVKYSLHTLDTLKSSLNFSNVGHGFDDITKSANKVNFNGLLKSAEDVRLKISGLQIAAIETFKRISNAAITAGKNLVKSFTVQPIMDGWNEYELKINSIQTIWSNTQFDGTTMDDIDKALDELNHYADKTIYKFGEMTRNIGYFTAAGVNLDTSVAAIKGLSNYAATAGVNSQKLSGAMYQLSQALAKGKVELLDWKSLETANMAGQPFQKELEDVARTHGIAIDEMIKRDGHFRNTLKDGWLTTEIMTETLQRYTGDLTDAEMKALNYTDEQIEHVHKLGKEALSAAVDVKTISQLMQALHEGAGSGWAKTFELILGNFTESKAFLTEVFMELDGVLGRISSARNEILAGWKLSGGRDSFLESIRNLYKAITSMIDPIHKAFRSMFPAKTSEELVAFTKRFEAFTKKLILTEEESENLKQTFRGLFSVFKFIKDIIVSLGKALSPVLSLFRPFADLLLNVTGRLGSTSANLEELIVNSKWFNSVFNGLGKAVEWVCTQIEKAINGASSAVSWLATEFRKAYEYIYNSLQTLWSDVKDGPLGLAFKNCSSTVNEFKSSFETSANSIKNEYASMSESADSWFDKLSILSSYITDMNSAVSSSYNSVKNNIKEASSGIADAFYKTKQSAASASEDMSTVSKTVTDVDTGLTSMNETTEKTSSKFNELSSVFVNAVRKIDLSFSNSSVGSWLAEVAGLLGGIVTSALKSVKSVLDSLNLKDIITIFKTIIHGELIMSMNKGVKSMNGLVDSFTSIVKRFKTGLDDIMGGEKESKATARANAFKTIAVSIAIMSGSLVLLSMIDKEQLSSALGVLVTLITVLGGLYAVIAHFVQSGNKTKKVADQIKDSVKNMLDASKIAQMLIGISVSVLLISTAVAKLAKLDSNGLKNGVLALGSIMTMVLAMFTGITGFITLFSKKSKSLTPQKFESVSKMMLTMAATVLIISSAIKKISNIDPKNLWNAVGAISTIMIVLTGMFAGIEGALHKLSKGNGPKKIQQASVLLLAVSVSLNIVTSAIKKIANLQDKSNPNKVWVAILQLTSMLAIFTGFAGILAELAARAPETKNILQVGVMMVGMSAAINMMVAAVSVLSLIPPERLMHGLSALMILSSIIGVLSILAASISQVGGSGSMAAFGAGLLVIAIGVNALSLSILTLSKIPWGDLTKGIGIMVALLGTLSIFAIQLAPFVPTLIAIGKTAGLIGAGMLGLSAALTLLSISIVPLCDAILYFGEVFDDVFASFMHILSLITENAGSIMGSLAIILVTGVQQILTVLAEQIEPIITAICDILVGIFNGLAENAQPIVDSLLNFVFKLGEALFNALGKIFVFLFTWSGESANKGWENIKTYVKQKWEETKVWWSEHKEQIKNAFKLLGRVVLGVVTLGGSELFRAGYNIIKKIVDIFKDPAKRAEIKTAAKDFIAGFINGIKEKITDVANAVKEIGSTVLTSLKDKLGIHSPSKEAFSLAIYFDEGFINGVAYKMSEIKNKAKDLGKQAMNSLRDAISNDSFIENQNGFEIKPKFNLDNVKNGFKEIKDWFNSSEIGATFSSMVYKSKDDLSLLGNKLKEWDTERKVNSKQEVYNPTFIINGAQDPKAVADECERKMAENINRRKKTWA